MHKVTATLDKSMDRIDLEDTPLAFATVAEIMEHLRQRVSSKDKFILFFNEDAALSDACNRRYVANAGNFLLDVATKGLK